MALSIAVLVLFSAPLSACPGAIFALETNPRVTGPRSGMRLFARDTGPDGKPVWRTLSLQVDPVDDDGHLVFFDNEQFKGKDSHPNDLMTFRVEQFGERMRFGEDKLPCRGSLTYELADRSVRKFAYLTNCGFQGTPASFPQLVAFDTKADKLESSTYQYRFNPDNYMQFNAISFKNKQGGWDEVASDSQLLIRADVKNFFTMQFDSDEIESQLEANRLGPVGNLARLSFFLRILAFKIKMSLSTDVGFYTDSGHIPMMVNIPVNAFDYLRPASGILYSWIQSPKAQASKREIDMPVLDIPGVRRGFKEHGKDGVKHCGKTDCRFRYTVDLDGRPLSMDLRVGRALVEKGFYPVFVPDVMAAKELMGWDIKAPKAGQKRVGMYFEVSGLPEGGHPWDFWLRLGGEGEHTAGCPTFVRVARVKDTVIK